MSETGIIFKNCYTGKDFELKVVEFLRAMGFTADKTGSPFTLLTDFRV